MMKPMKRVRGVGGAYLYGGRLQAADLPAKAQPVKS